MPILLLRIVVQPGDIYYGRKSWKKQSDLFDRLRYNRCSLLSRNDQSLGDKTLERQFHRTTLDSTQFFYMCKMCHDQPPIMLAF